MQAWVSDLDLCYETLGKFSSGRVIHLMVIIYLPEYINTVKTKIKVRKNSNLIRKNVITHSLKLKR